MSDMGPPRSRKSTVLLAMTAAFAGMAIPAFNATEHGGIALPLSPRPQAWPRDEERSRRLAARALDERPLRPYGFVVEERVPTPEERAAEEKRARKAAKYARDAARREAGSPRRVEPRVEGHRIGFPTTITVEGRNS